MTTTPSPAAPEIHTGAPSALRPEVASRDAAYRYLHDAEFHVRVDRGVLAAGQTGVFITDKRVKAIAVHVAAMTLHLDDLRHLPTACCVDGDGPFEVDGDGFCVGCGTRREVGR